MKTLLKLKCTEMFFMCHKNMEYSTDILGFIHTYELNI